ncbi:MAG: hypothetical protein II103_05260, partial [Treponema sp.]|nr:hypothetical protein [Treponema sp.]
FIKEVATKGVTELVNKLMQSCGKSTAVNLIQTLWFDKLTNRFRVTGQPSYTNRPGSQSKGQVNDGSYAIQMLWFDKLTNRFSVTGQPSSRTRFGICGGGDRLVAY